MPLESVTYINDLVATNPVGATDPKSQGDDHLRNIKAALLATFPNVTGAMTATHTALNGAGALYTADAAAAGMLADIAALTDPNADRLLGWDDSAGAVVGFTIGTTGLAISSTTVDIDTTKVPLLASSNTFTGGTQTFEGMGVLSLKSSTTGAGVNHYISFQNSAALELGYVGFAVGASSIFSVRNAVAGAELRLSTNSGSITLEGVASTDFARLSQSNTFSKTSDNTQIVRSSDANKYAAIQFGNNGATTAYFGISGTGASVLISGSSTGDAVIQAQGKNIRMSGDSGSSVGFQIDSSNNFNFYDGTVTTSNASASEVGKAGAPSRDITVTDNTVAGDMGKTIRMTAGVSKTFTLDSDPPEDAVVILDNASGNAWTIAASSSLVWAATGGTGARTLADGGMAVALHQGSGVWKISGGGLS